MVAMALFAGEVWVHYQFVNVHDAEGWEWEIGDECRGQANGLCGAAVPGLLHLVTGLHTGKVGFTVELHPAEPPLDDVWEEAVEVSFTSTAEDIGLHPFQDQYLFNLPPGDYRVRYCARGMDQGKAEDTLAGVQPVDFYLLQFWPGTAAPDRIIRQTSKTAAYWHRANSKRPLTAEEQAQETRDERERRERYDRDRWGDRVPNERLRAVNGISAGFLEPLDMDLVFTLSEADDSVHRAVACWAALRAAEVAGMVDLPALAPAIAALRRGRPVPPPFDDSGYMWSRFADAVPRTTVMLPPDGEIEQTRQDWAIVALFHSAVPDSMTAAYQALSGAAGAYGMGYRQLFSQLRDALPQLGT
jgi:hypothetical protein